jgi:tRNA dimethylallyltransferase
MATNSNNVLIALPGATGVGKTETSLLLAEHFAAPVISADSRQFYRELKIGTAAPTAAELSRAKHYFIASHSISDSYSCGQYELDVIKLLETIFENKKFALLAGGSMMYIDAVCKGIDDIPTVDAQTRSYWLEQYRTNGAEYLQKKLLELDPKHYGRVDLENTKRVLHALEICSITGAPYSDILTGKTKLHPFTIVKAGLKRPREELYERINLRVDKMMEEGLEKEAFTYYEHRSLNTLNTVGYKELFEYFDGNITKEKAVELIKRNTRHYAKRQLSWFERDKEIRWFHPDNVNEIITYIENKTINNEKL